MQTYTFARGEDIAIALDAVAGDPATVNRIDAQLRVIPTGRAVLPDTGVAAADFLVTARAATVDAPAGWTLFIPAATTVTFVAGNYVADARLQVAGGVAMTDQIGIRLRTAITTGGGR